MKITKDITYIGLDDHSTDLFESQYKIEKGVSYNSYIIKSNGVSAVMDTVEKAFVPLWLEKIEKEMDGKSPTYLVIHHMEPDHSSGILAFVDKYPEAKIVSSQKAFTMMKNFFQKDFSASSVVIKEGSTLTIGEHILSFIAAPMVHWPEVMVSYDSLSKVLFSADAFGTFGANDTVSTNWKDEARRYYIGIVGKYGQMVQSLLKKASSLDIEIICPLHGPVLDSNLSFYLGLYDTWSKYEAEENGVTICYTSVYGHTKEAALLLEEKLKKEGVSVSTFDLARSELSEAVSYAFFNKTLVLATTTYNGDIFPYMRTFISALCERNFQKRRVAFIENGSWGIVAKRIMTNLLSEQKDIEWAENSVTITSSLDPSSLLSLEKLAKELAN